MGKGKRRGNFEKNNKFRICIQPFAALLGISFPSGTNRTKPIVEV